MSEDDELDPDEAEADDELDHSDDDDGPTVEQVARMIEMIPKLLPDAVVDVNGKMMTAAEIVAQMQAYLDSVAATAAAKQRLDEAEREAEKSGEALEAAIRAHHEANKSSPKN